MAISFSNIPSGVRVPLFYAEVDNSQANIGSNTRKALLIGQKVSSGKAEDGVPVLVTGFPSAHTVSKVRILCIVLRIASVPFSN